MDEELRALDEEHEESNTYLLEAMAAAIAAWLLLAGEVTQAELRKFVYDTYPGVVAPYQSQAIQEAYGFYLRQRTLAGIDTPITPPAEEEITEIRNTALKTGVVASVLMANPGVQGRILDNVVGNVNKIATNAVLEADRGVQVSMSTNDAARSRTIWSAESDACPWCLDMDGTPVRRISSHDNCKCSLLTEFY